MLSCPQGQIIDGKCEKSQLIGHFDFFAAVIELVRELLISNMHNKFKQRYMNNFSSFRAHKVKLLMYNAKNRNNQPF